MTTDHSNSQLADSADHPLPTCNAFITALSPLWVGGVAVLCVVAANVASSWLSQYWERAIIWAPYLTLGTLFPAILAMVVIWQRGGRRMPVSLTIALIALPIVAAAVVVGPLHVLAALGLAQLQTALCVAIGSRHDRFTLARVVSLVAFSFIAWAAILKIFLWEPMQTVMPPSWPTLLVGAIALFACCWWAWGGANLTQGSSCPRQRVIDLLFVVALVLLAFRTDGLFITDRLGEGGTFYHWGTMVGPAEAVRQGGWLFWDVPSPYGFLMTLTLAAFPAASAWQALYLLNAIASASIAIWLYFTLRAVRPNIIGSIIVFAMTAAVVYLVSTYPPTLSPEHYFPMSGAFRYVWCFVLVGVLLLERRTEVGSRHQQTLLLAGSACWLLSMIWSAESALYGSTIWIPTFVLILLRDCGFFSAERRWKALVLWLLLPPLLLVGTVTTIVLIYRQALGQTPDPLSYVEVVLSFSGTRASEVSGQFGSMAFPSTIVVIVLGFLLLALAAAAIARSHSCRRDLPAAIGLALGMWGLLSYPAGQPFLFAIYRVMPFLVLALGIVLATMAPRYRARPDGSWVDVVTVGSVAMLAGLLTTAYANGTELQFYANAIRSETFLGGDVTAGLPRVAPALETLLQQVGVAAADPIYYAGGAYGDLMPVWTPTGASEPVRVSRQWLAGPISTMALLPNDRKQTYLERSSARRFVGGWLIQNRNKDDIVYDVDAWFFEQLGTTHVPTKVAYNDEWQLTWYEPRDEAPVVPPAMGAPAEDPRVTGDLLVNGESLTDDVAPPLWGFFGPEWTEPTGDKQWRCTSNSGKVRLFSSSPRRARLVLVFPRNTLSGALHIAVNEKEPVAADTTEAGKATAPVALNAGWNSITIARVPAADPPHDVAAACESDDADGSLLQIKSVEVRTRN